MYEIDRFKPHGFHEVPDNDIILVHRDGRCINRLTGRSITVSLNKQGYKMVMVNVKGKTLNFYHHRLIARAFVEKDIRHDKLSYNDLEVNHIDWDKENNIPENLEWCTPEENMEHALKNGLLGHEPVLARNIRTNFVKKYINATECAKVFKIGFKRLRRHLKSPQAGYVTKQNCVFKHDNGIPWPALKDQHLRQDTWDLQFGVWIARSVNSDDKKIIADTLKDLAQALEVSESTLRQHLSNKPDLPYRNWVIAFDPFSFNEALEETRRFRDRVLFPSKNVTVTNTDTGEITHYGSRNIAAEALSIHSDKIRYALKAKNGMVNNFHIVES